ncbi:hypothetical protein [Fundidesulfovibrio putealis]|uniref:hypothetical protein n=1 Tax=Fundidesulfovibrio putealis TaxID=270496 RepID=UPI0003FB2B5B|nr:hypothetical protein [Fundidesulfovibrio putealis]
MEFYDLLRFSCIVESEKDRLFDFACDCVDFIQYYESNKTKYNFSISKLIAETENWKKPFKITRNIFYKVMRFNCNLEDLIKVSFWLSKQVPFNKEYFSHSEKTQQFAKNILNNTNRPLNAIRRFDIDRDKISNYVEHKEKPVKMYIETEEESLMKAMVSKEAKLKDNRLECIFYQNKRFLVKIVKDNKSYYVGKYKILEDAIAAARNFRNEIGKNSKTVHCAQCRAEFTTYNVDWKYCPKCYEIYAAKCRMEKETARKNELIENLFNAYLVVK